MKCLARKIFLFSLEIILASYVSPSVGEAEKGHSKDWLTTF